MVCSCFAGLLADVVELGLCFTLYGGWMQVVCFRLAGLKRGLVQADFLVACDLVHYASGFGFLGLD